MEFVTGQIEPNEIQFERYTKLRVQVRNESTFRQAEVDQTYKDQSHLPFIQFENGPRETLGPYPMMATERK